MWNFNFLNQAILKSRISKVIKFLTFAFSSHLVSQNIYLKNWPKILKHDPKLVLIHRPEWCNLHFDEMNEGWIHQNNSPWNLSDKHFNCVWIRLVSGWGRRWGRGRPRRCFSIHYLIRRLVKFCFSIDMGCLCDLVNWVTAVCGGVVFLDNFSLNSCGHCVRTHSRMTIKIWKLFKINKIIALVLNPNKLKCLILLNGLFFYYWIEQFPLTQFQYFHFWKNLIKKVASPHILTLPKDNLFLHSKTWEILFSFPFRILLNKNLSRQKSWISQNILF